MAEPGSRRIGQAAALTAVVGTFGSLLTAQHYNGEAAARDQELKLKAAETILKQGDLFKPCTVPEPYKSTAAKANKGLVAGTTDKPSPDQIEYLVGQHQFIKQLIEDGFFGSHATRKIPDAMRKVLGNDVKNNNCARVWITKLSPPVQEQPPSAHDASNSTCVVPSVDSKYRIYFQAASDADQESASNLQRRVLNEARVFVTPASQGIEITPRYGRPDISIRYYGSAAKAVADFVACRLQAGGKQKAKIQMADYSHLFPSPNLAQTIEVWLPVGVFVPLADQQNPATTKHNKKGDQT